MQRLLPLSLCLLALAGCARKSPLPGAAGNAANAQVNAVAPQPVEWPVWDPSGTGQPVHKATQKTAPQLGEQLLRGRDPTAVTKAAAALGEMGEHGYPHLYKGLTSNDEAVRVVSLQNLTSTQLVKNQRETMALMVRFLGDANPDVRKAAVGNLTYFGKAAVQYQATLQGMSQADPDAGVRAAALTAAITLQEARTGKTITSADSNPFGK